MRLKLKKISFVLTSLLFFAALFTAEAQIKYAKKRGSRSRPQHLGCEYVGVPKIQKVKFAKYLQKESSEKIAPVSTRSSSPSLAKKTGKKSKALASATSSSAGSLLAGSEKTATDSLATSGTSVAAVSIASPVKSKKDSLKAVSAAEAKWYTTAKPAPPDAAKIAFNNDEDDLTSSEISALKIAEKHIRYGYNVHLVEFIPKNDVDTGRNTSYMRLNKIKSNLLKLGAPPDKIFLKSCSEEERPIGEKFIKIEIVD
jgi:hypothetical protein